MSVCALSVNYGDPFRDTPLLYTCTSGVQEVRCRHVSRLADYCATCVKIVSARPSSYDMRCVPCAGIFIHFFAQSISSLSVQCWICDRGSIIIHPSMIFEFNEKNSIVNSHGIVNIFPRTIFLFKQGEGFRSQTYVQQIRFWSKYILLHVIEFQKYSFDTSISVKNTFTIVVRERKWNTGEEA